MLVQIVAFLAAFTEVNAQFGFFDQMFQQQQQQRPRHKAEGSSPMERIYHEIDCQQYLCPDTMACVPEPLECPCRFPDSEIKCILPDKSSYVCFSAPSDGEGPDCDYVLSAYNGKI